MDRHSISLLENYLGCERKVKKNRRKEMTDLALEWFKNKLGKDDGQKQEHTDFDHST